MDIKTLARRALFITPRSWASYVSGPPNGRRGVGRCLGWLEGEQVATSTQGSNVATLHNL